MVPFPSCCLLFLYIVYYATFIILVSTYVIYAFEEFKWIVFISTRRGVVFSVATNFA